MYISYDLISVFIMISPDNHIPVTSLLLVPL